jgi:NAD(P)-dependent dehydrogenase (short-subunit alcohol dehydrogenase family)
MVTQGDVAIITGAGQGIGKAIARRLLEDGYRVVIAEIDPAAGKETEAELSALGEVVFVPTDVRSDEDIRRLVERSVQRFGRINALVNNAGIFIEESVPLAELGLEEWRRVIDTNLTSVFLCSKHASAFLRKTRGAIVNIASTRALMSEPNTEAYAASKGGIVALTHALAVSLGPEVRVNCISPGWIETSAWKKKDVRHEAKLRPEDHRQHPAGRVGRPEDIAAMAAFLIDPRNGFVTGANMVVDGGMTRKMIYV